MSRVLFICSGNTCRSPMAEAVAKRIFGPSHKIVSAGAETGSGLPIARHAVTAMSEMKIDISKYRTVDFADLDLADFDLIVAFRLSGPRPPNRCRSLHTANSDIGTSPIHTARALRLTR
jgi:protein-tyrosine-phosphatase